MFGQIRMDSISHPNAAEDRGLRKWFFLALLISLIFHAVLAALFQAKKLEHFQTGPVVPPARAEDRVQSGTGRYDPNIFQSTAPTQAEEPKPHQTCQSPRPSCRQTLRQIPKNVIVSPRVTETPKFVAESEKPNVKAPSAPIEGREAAPTKTSSATAEGCLRKTPINPGSRQRSPSPLRHGEGGASGTGKGTGAYSKLNSLLAQTGEITGPVAPVNMPGGALFEYDSADASPGRDRDPPETRENSLLRNPRATFSIEGHTDSFGTPDYNLDSQRGRARAVKAWLIAEHAPRSFQDTDARALAVTRLIVPATKNGRETPKKNNK